MNVLLSLAKGRGIKDLAWNSCKIMLLYIQPKLLRIGFMSMVFLWLTGHPIHLI